MSDEDTEGAEVAIKDEPAELEVPDPRLDMVSFVVLAACPDGQACRPVLRVGTCARHMVEAQATQPGEIAVEADEQLIEAVLAVPDSSAAPDMLAPARLDPLTGEVIPAEYGVLEASQAARDIQSARHLLARTDWYVIRQSETGTPIPAHVARARSDARAAINAGRARLDADPTDPLHPTGRIQA